MVQQRPNQFGGPSRFGITDRPALHAQILGGPGLSASPSVSRSTGLAAGLGNGARGLGKAKGIKRHTKIRRDTIHAVTKGDIRRLARRGGVKRISATIYDDIRGALKDRLTKIMKDVIAMVELRGAKTVSVRDIIYVLNMQGNTLWGFDPEFLGSR